MFQIFQTGFSLNKKNTFNFKDVKFSTNFSATTQQEKGIKHKSA